MTQLSRAYKSFTSILKINLRLKLEDNRRNRKGPAGVYGSLEQHRKMFVKFLEYPRK